MAPTVAAFDLDEAGGGAGGLAVLLWKTGTVRGVEVAIETGTGIGRWAMGLLERVAATLLVGVLGLEV